MRSEIQKTVQIKTPKRVSIEIMPTELREKRRKYDIYSIIGKSLAKENAPPESFATTFNALSKYVPVDFPFAAREIWHLGLDDVDFLDFAKDTSGFNNDDYNGLRAYEVAEKIFGPEVLGQADANVLGSSLAVLSSRNHATTFLRRRLWALPGIQKRDGKRFYLPRIYVPKKSVEEIAWLYRTGKES